MKKKLLFAAMLCFALCGQAFAGVLELGKTYEYEQPASSWDDLYSDFSYTATEDGVLVFKSNQGLNGYVSVDGGEEKSVSFTSSDYTNYFCKVQVKAGSKYEFSFYTWKSYTVSAELTHPKLGSDYDVAIQAEAGQQTLAAEAGTTWYVVTATKDGVLHVSGEGAFAGGKVGIYAKGYDGAPSSWIYEESAEGVFDVTMEVDAGSSYFVKVVKATATASEQTFTIAMEDHPAGSNDSNPIMLSALPYTGSAPVGTTYYAVAISKEQAGQMITMAATSPLNNEYSNCSLYPQGDSYNQVYGDASVESVVSEGTYILKWVNYESDPIAFTVSMKTLQAGQTIETPLTAVVGDNDFKGSGTWYYKYTASKNCKLSITPSDASINVTFPKGTGAYDGAYELIKTGDTFSIAAEAGQEYLVKFEYVTDESWFTLEEGTFQKGETRDNPIEVTNGTYTFGTAQTVWLSYTVDKVGKLTMACDAEYSYSNVLQYYTPGVNYAESLSSWDADYNSVYIKTIMVKAGDVIVVNAVMANNESGKKITFSIAEPEQGETSSNPLVVTQDQHYDIPSVDYGSAYWMKAHLTPGDYRFYSSDYISAFYYDTPAKVAADEEDYDDKASINNEDEAADASYFKFTITEEKDVYFKILRSYGAFSAWISAEGNATGISAVRKSGNANYYDLQGRKVTTLVPGNLYIRNGKKVVF